MKKLLSFSQIYRLFSWFIGTSKAHRKFAFEYIKPKDGQKILEIGCGCGDLVPFLGKASYWGVDISAEYIETAKSRFSKKGHFICSTLEAAKIDDQDFEKIISYGVLHHLSDNDFKSTFEKIMSLSGPYSEWFSVDPVTFNNQRKLARLLIKHDRGQFVRTEEKYIELLRPFYSHIETFHVSDWLNIPYDHLVIRATGPRKKLE